MGNSLSSTYHCPGLHPNHSLTYPYFHCSRGHSSFAIRVDTTRGATDTGYKPSLDWRAARRQELFLTVGENPRSHWTALAHLKLGSLQPIWCCPATVCHPHWVHGDNGPPEQQTATTAPGNYRKSQQKRQALKQGCLGRLDNDWSFCKPARYQRFQEDSSH